MTARDTTSATPQDWREARFGALVAGASLLLMAIIAGLANFGAVQSVIVAGNGEATAAALLTSMARFRLGAVGLAVVAFLDVLVAWGLYLLFRREAPAGSLLGGWLRLAYAAIFALAISGLFTAARLAPLDPAMTLLELNNFNDAWLIGQIFFGFHLLVVGYLAYRSRLVHWFFGILLVISGVGYLFDGIAQLLNPGFGVELAVYTFPGEVIFILWLLVKGARLRDS